MRSSDFPDLSGVWELNLEKSVLKGPSPRRMTVTVEHDEPNISQHIRSIRTDGTEQLQSVKFTVGTEEVNSIRGVPLRTLARWEGKELVVESWMKMTEREFHFKDYWSVSDDGRTLTMAHRDDDLAGQVSILQKQA